MSAYLSTVSMKTLATDIKGLFTNSKIRLSQGTAPISVNSVLSDFTEADFGGYASLENAANVLVFDDATGDWVTQPGTVAAFTADNTITAPQTVSAAYITNTAGTSLIAFSTIDPNFTFVNDGDGLIVSNLIFRLPQNVAQS